MQALATQMVIQNVLGELGASSDRSDPTPGLYVSGAALSKEHDILVSSSKGQAGSMYSLVRKPESKGSRGPAFISFAAVTPKGSSLLLILSGCLSCAIVPLRNRLRRQEA